MRPAQQIIISALAVIVGFLAAFGLLAGLYPRSGSAVIFWPGIGLSAAFGAAVAVARRARTKGGNVEFS
jgi:hypothetical protein